MVQRMFDVYWMRTIEGERLELCHYLEEHWKSVINRIRENRKLFDEEDG